MSTSEYESGFYYDTSSEELAASETQQDQENEPYIQPVMRSVQASSDQSSSEESVSQKIENYGQQLQYELRLRGWTQEQLAEEIGVSKTDVQNWEDNQSVPDLASRQKLTNLLGNDFYLSSEVTPSGTLQVRIVQRQLIAQDFTTILSALTRLNTQFWLIQQGRLDDLIEFAETQDSHFVEEANLIITGLSYNSPALITFLTAPGTITGAATGAVTFALALQKVVDAIAQARKKLKTAEVEIEKEKLDLEKEKLKVKEMQRDFALETANKLFDVLYPGADEQTRATVMPTIVPTFSQLLNMK